MNAAGRQDLFIVVIPKPDREGAQIRDSDSDRDQTRDERAQ